MDENSSKAQKKALRGRILKQRDALSDEERKRAQFLITESIIRHPWYEQSDCLLCFCSYGSEISTKEILLDALDNKKKVFVPKVKGEEMIFARIHDLSELQEGFHGIPEPVSGDEIYQPKEDSFDQTLLIMPGVAFDMLCNRIGYGGGYYDKFLEMYPELLLRSIAIGFRCQMLDEILPAQETDKKPYQVICV